jgi:LytS/YehU family sensor histidine kinase
MTWWFITSMLVLSIALISLILFLRLQKSNQLALEKETLKTKAAKMEMRALRSQMNPHFIFNSINSIQHYILNHDKLIAQQMLSSFAKLMRNVLENSASEFIPLSKEIDTLNLYLKMESERFESKFNFNIHVDENIDMITTLVPPMIIQPMVENAILHGMVPLKGIVGKLSITLRIRGEFILCIIYDNGIGRKRSAQIKSAKGTHHQSNGIQITKERLQLCYKAIGYLPEFDMQISDHTKQDGTAEGTEVQIMLPIQKLK